MDKPTLPAYVPAPPDYEPPPPAQPIGPSPMYSQQTNPPMGPAPAYPGQPASHPPGIPPMQPVYPQMQQAMPQPYEIHHAYSNSNQPMQLHQHPQQVVVQHHHHVQQPMFPQGQPHVVTQPTTKDKELRVESVRKLSKTIIAFSTSSFILGIIPAVLSGGLYHLYLTGIWLGIFQFILGCIGIGCAKNKTSSGTRVCCMVFAIIFSLATFICFIMASAQGAYMTTYMAFFRWIPGAWAAYVSSVLECFLFLALFVSDIVLATFCSGCCFVLPSDKNPIQNQHLQMQTSNVAGPSQPAANPHGQVQVVQIHPQ